MPAVVAVKMWRPSVRYVVPAVNTLSVAIPPGATRYALEQEFAAENNTVKCINGAGATVGYQRTIQQTTERVAYLVPENAVTLQVTTGGSGGGLQVQFYY